MTCSAGGAAGGTKNCDIAVAPALWPSGARFQAFSIVRSSESCVTAVVTRSPAGVCGDATTSGMWPPPPAAVTPSSHAMNSALVLNSGDWRICGTTVDSHASPVATEQSCMSWHTFGVIQTKLASRPLARSLLKLAYGTTWLAQRAGSDVMSA